jgi:heme/copper-type cytochrome/quinol oxidase subunit 2
VGNRAVRRHGVLLFLAVFLLTGSWALATPPFAAPDEPAHVYRAAAVVRGDLVPPRDADLPPGLAFVDVPAGLVDSAERIGCFKFHPDVPASCVGDPGPDDELVETPSSAARYHPVYYAAIGWPSFFLSDNAAVFAMRLVSALIVSVLISVGLVSAREHPQGRLLVTGAVVALTPMVLFLGGTINPNAVEIAAGFAVWGVGLSLIASDDAGRQRVLLRRLSLVAMAEVVTRTISPLWLLLSLLTLVALAGGPRTMALLRLRSVRWWVPAVGLVTLASVAWTVLTDVNTLPPASAERTGFLAAVRLVLEVTPMRLGQYVGQFGWLDTDSPTISLIALTVLIGALLFLGLSFGGRRSAAVLLGLALAVFAVPILIEAAGFNSTAYFWQMRYTMPLAVGLPMVAAVVAAPGLTTSARAAGRLPGLFVVTAALAHLLCFVWALRRYQVGVSAPLGTLEGSWAPRVGTLTVIGLQVLGLVVLCLVAVRRSGDADAGLGTAGPDDRAGTSPTDGRERPPVAAEVTAAGPSVPDGAHPHAVQ